MAEEKEFNRWADFNIEELVLLVRGIRIAVTRDTNIPVTPREFAGYCKLTSEIQEEVTARNQIHQKSYVKEPEEEMDPNAGSE